MKFLYIFPGYQDTVQRKPYQLLKKEAEGIGYSVMCVDIDWNKPISRQMFLVQDNSILIGFSMGGIFARMISQENKIKILIQASVTPIKYFTDKSLVKDISDAIGEKLVKDIARNLKQKNNAKKTVTLYGDKEQNAGADIIVKNTGHILSKEYIDEIIKLI